eukprot:2621224-Ditylum_brightwellii.AAC.1
MWMTRIEISNCCEQKLSNWDQQTVKVYAKNQSQSVHDFCAILANSVKMHMTLKLYINPEWNPVSFYPNWQKHEKSPHF